MTKKDFFTVIIKLFGLYLTIEIVFSTIPNNLSFVLTYIDIPGFIWLLFTAAIVVALFIFLIYKANTITSLLKLEKGFDEDRIDFGNLKISDIVKFAVLIIGGLVFIDSIPVFLSHTLFAFKSSAPKGFDTAQNELIKYNDIKDYLQWFISGLNLLIGYLLFTNYKKVSEFILRKIDDKTYMKNQTTMD